MPQRTTLSRAASGLIFAMLAVSLQLPLRAAGGAQADPAHKPMSAAQARELFRSVDTILQFDSRETGLPVLHGVQRKLLSRDQIVAILKQKMAEDKDTARIERSAIVLEKFGLLPPHFALRPFLLKLLGEQIAGFYDSKTKTVNLLDWIGPDEQKPVLAHELTHALQDQYQTAHGTSLDKWENPDPEGAAQTAPQDRKHVRLDETGTAREAVLEGQAMVSYIDWGLADRNTAQTPSQNPAEARTLSLRTVPELTLDQLNSATGSDASSPILATAPVVLRESLLFPYQEGLLFEQQLLKDEGTAAAFSNVLDKPPGTSYQILNPRFFERGGAPPVLAMADLHPLLDPDWAPYDVGAMGALDVRMLTRVLADKGAAADAAAAWDGGVYYAAQARSATTAEARASTASIALVYLSRWSTEGAAEAFAKLYAASLSKRYAVLQPLGDGVYQTSEGPVLVRREGRYVFVSHSLPVPLAQAVMAAMLTAQASPAAADSSAELPSLSAPLRGLMAHAGFLRAAGAIRAAVRSQGGGYTQPRLKPEPTP